MNKLTMAAAGRYWPLVQAVAADVGLPATLIMGILWRESLFGLALHPVGPTGTGDLGHGRGLMQIDDRAHRTWVSSHDWADPLVNVRKGAEVLRDARNVFVARGYSGEQCWRMALAAYNAGTRAVLAAVQAGKDPDLVTTGKDYSKFVLERVKDLELNGFGG